MRLVMILACGTRQVIDAVFGSDQTGELTYGTQLTASLTPGMLLLADRNFATYRMFADIARAGADFLIRAKTGTGAMTLPVTERLPDGSWLADARGTPVRVIDATVTITTDVGVRTGRYRLITTLLNPAEASAHELVELYHQRWEIETSFCELKSTILNGRVLRGRYPAAITQEVWAILTAYQALRIAISDTALVHGGIDPDRLSFTIALHTARDQIIQAAHTVATTSVDLTGRIGAAIPDEILPARRVRTRQRVIKRAIPKYRAKGQHVDRRTYPATLRTQIHTTGPEP